MENTAASGRLRRPRRLVDEVRDRIANDFIFSGTIKPGELLPSEKELTERYGVSRITLRSGIRSLQDAGMVAVRHGVGTAVLPRSDTVMHSLERLSSIDTFAREADKPVDTADLEWQQTPADSMMASRLGIDEGSPVLTVRRVKLIGGDRAAWVVDHLVAGILPFEVVEGDFEGSILDVLLAHDDTGLAYADSEVTPVNLAEDIAGRLGVEPGTAALHLDTVACAINGQPIEWSQAWVLPEHFRFHIRRRPPIG